MHAGKGWDEDGAKFIKQLEPNADLTEPYEPGSVVAVFRIKEACVVSRLVVDRWAFGPVCWLVEGLVWLPKSVPVTGHQKFWNLPSDVEKLVRSQLCES